MAEITGVLLAAGFSSRFGDNKLLYELNRRPLIEYGIHALAPCDRTIAVVRADDVELQSVLHARGVDSVFNPEPERGIGYSIACAVNASSRSSGWCMLPADMPYISVSTTQRLVDALRAGAGLAAPYYRGRRGHPVAFSDRFFDALSGLDGDIGARNILSLHADELIAIATDDEGVLADIDTTADVE
jgi:molybdenum cofactor cytidylyltransferase